MAPPRAQETIVAAGRVAIGAAMLADPARFGRPWLGAPAETGGGGVAVRALGARDFALGTLTLAALTGRLGSPSTAAVLVGAGGFCDLADGVALLVARKDVPAAGAATGVFAVACALFGFAAARRLHAA